MQTFQVEKLPEVDQREIKRGLCPWCLVRLVEDAKNDICPECGDVFTGKISIQD